MSQTNVVFSLAPMCLGFLWARPEVWAKSGAALLSRENPTCPTGHKVHTVGFKVAKIGWYLILLILHHLLTHWDHSSPVRDLSMHACRCEAGGLCWGWVLAAPLLSHSALDMSLALWWSFPLRVEQCLICTYLLYVLLPRLADMAPPKTDMAPALPDLMCW